MAVTLDATVGGVDSNTYCTLAAADTFHEDHLYATDWTSAADANKNIALVMATRVLDEQMNWHGNQDTETQALLWPRNSVYDRGGYLVDNATIPAFLQRATAELARYLIASDRTADDDTKGFSKIKVGPIDLRPDKYDRAPVLPKAVWLMVRHYGTKVGKTRTLVRQ